MIIVHNTSGGNDIKFINREGYNIKVTLTDEVTGDVLEEIIEFTQDGYYTTCTLESDLTDGSRYRLQVLTSDTLTKYIEREEDVSTTVITDELIAFVNETVGDVTTVLYHGILLCTTQDTDSYSINDGKYDETLAPAEETPKYNIL